MDATLNHQYGEGRERAHTEPPQEGPHCGPCSSTFTSVATLAEGLAAVKNACSRSRARWTTRAPVVA